MKLVTVIIPVYQVEKYIAKTINSVLVQTYKNFELLIVDDGSTDRSYEICQQFTDPRIQIIRQQNQGVAAARNTGIRHAQGDYVALLDGDDLWVPHKLEKHVEHLDKSPNVGLSFSRSAFIDEADKPLGIYQMSKLTDITPLDLLCRTPIGNGSVPTIRKELLEAIKFIDPRSGEVSYFDCDRSLHPSEDVECWLRMMLKTDWKIEGLAEALTLYRVNPKGFSAQLYKKLSSWETMLKKARAYTSPEMMAEWEKPAMAYQLRHLARRAVTLSAGSTAVEFSFKALSTYMSILFEEPRRTVMTLAAAYLLWLLPNSTYHQIQSLALQITGSNQKRKILQEVKE
ncbi:glucosyl transferase [cyanobacterium TDX16]|nr:glucosyl transferase [cyanobacterium TDX16]